MNSVFDLDGLKGLLRDFYNITGIRITVFDSAQRELASYPETLPEFCSLIRASEAGNRACSKCDAEACRAAARHPRTQIYRCHAGMTEAIVPLHVGEVLAGYLLFGNAFAYDSVEEGWKEVSECVRELPVDMDALKHACAERPLMSMDYIRSAAHILHATASYMILERMAVRREDGDAAGLDAYLNEHYTERITSECLCRELNIGRTRLYKLSAQLYGCGITQQVRRLRVDRAKRLLISRPDMSITDIAIDCGFSDYNYFISVFSQSEGLSPTAYRRGKSRG